MYKRVLRKPDGRLLVLYGLNPISPEIQPALPPGDSIKPNPHLRWHPLRGEWVLKFLAGTEIGAGMFTSDTFPEEKAAELQQIQVQIE